MLRPNNAATQRERILQTLARAQGAWVPLPEIVKQAAQYNARIFELRRLGHAIENRHHDVDGVRHSWFRLAHTPSPQTSRAKPTAEAAGTPHLFDRNGGAA